MITEPEASRTELEQQISGSRVNPPPGLQRLALQRRLDALFRALASDFLLREQFVTDPAQVTAEYVLGRRIPAQRAAALNYLLYASLASQRLIQWFRAYAIQQTDIRKITKKRFIEDFAKAVAQTGSHHVVEGLAKMALSSTPALQLEDSWLQVIFGPWRHFGEDGTGDTGTDSTGTDSTGTDSTGTGTDSTGTGTDVTGTGTDVTGTGTEITGTGTGTDITGTGTETGTGTDITGTGTLTNITLTDGTLTDGTLTAVTWSTFITGTGTGTFGTGTSTESTTPFTHTGITRSPFTTFTTDRGPNDPYFFGMSYVIVALDALTSYARQLQRAGELSSIWME
jgi:hypothetical protein